MQSKVEIIKKPIENIGNNLKKTAWMSVFESLIMILVGVFLVAWPDVVVKVLAYVLGTFFIVKGVYQIINYFVIKGQNDFLNNDLLWGVISTLAGVAVFFLGEQIGNIFRIIVGVWIIYASLVKINTAIKMSSVGIGFFKYVLIAAIIMLIIGTFITFYSGAVTLLIGWMMVVSGLISIFDDVVFMQNVDKIVDKITNR